MSETYDVYAVQYARSQRPSRDFFIYQDPHDGPLPIFYYVWLIRNERRAIVVDMGFSAEMGKKRGREFLRCPGEGLRVLGVDPAEVETVVVTHMHYDHAGNVPLFPRATFVLQDAEMQFATGRDMRHKPMRMAFEVEDVVDLVRRNFEGRVRFVNGMEEIAPGVCVHHVGGHTRGLQAVSVETARGRLVLASDAVHFFENMTETNPFPIVADVGHMFDGYERLLRLAGDPDRLIPGHDPLVAELYPAAAGDPMIFELSKAPLRPSPLSGR